MRTLLDEVRDAGVEHTARWDGMDGEGRPVASGVYFVRLTANGVTQSRKITLVK